MNRVNAVIVGAGAGGGIVAKELAEAGLSVVLLERGKWYTAFDCRKDDLRNQRNSTLGNAFGPDDERNPRVAVDLAGNVYVADTYNSTIRKVTTGGVVLFKTFVSSVGEPTFATFVKVPLAGAVTVTVTLLD